MDYGATDLLEAVVDSILATIEHTLRVLMTHVHHVVHGEADEYNETDGLCQSDAPAAQVDDGHDGSHNDADGANTKQAHRVVVCCQQEHQITKDQRGDHALDGVREHAVLIGHDGPLVERHLPHGRDGAGPLLIHVCDNVLVVFVDTLPVLERSAGDSSQRHVDFEGSQLVIDHPQFARILLLGILNHGLVENLWLQREF